MPETITTIAIYKSDLPWIKDCCKKKNCNQSDLIRKIKIAVEAKHTQEFYKTLQRPNNVHKPLSGTKIQSNYRK